MSREIIIIGVTGTHASGKDTVADYICSKYHLKSYSTSDEIRHEATRTGIEHTRANLANLGNHLREEYGPGELAKRAFERVSKGEKVALITGIRNTGEIDFLRGTGHFALISVDGPIEMRYERATRREREGEHKKTFEEFRASEEKELNQGGAGQQLVPCMRQADYFIVNDGTLEELGQRIDEVVRAILHSSGL